MPSYNLCSLVPSPVQYDEPGVEDWPQNSLHIGVVNSKVWPIGHTLKICLMGGSDKVREKVETYAREWTKYANINMDFMDNLDEAEVRVSFKKGSSWSLLGTDCLAVSTRATMNFGWFDDNTTDRILARTVYHEFGHALGLIHEHQSPDGGIKWDEARVYEYYFKEMDWDQETVDRNVLTKYNKTTTQFSRFDRKSIMLYHFPEELTSNGGFVHPNDVLSSMDKEFIGRLYPKEASNASTPRQRLRRRKGASKRSANPQPLRRSPRIARRKRATKGPTNSRQNARPRILGPVL
ncbi:hypothetical protein F4861DRAFT_526524 [Xylaria intraflava]|nr:hypothetical protein F4861DRAFT_526524 [Xylaria intraflava]